MCVKKETRPAQGLIEKCVQSQQVLFCFLTFAFSALNGFLGIYHWTIYALFRLLSVFGSAGVGVTFFVLIVESVGHQYRLRLGLLYITTSIGVGMILLTFIAKCLKNWELVQFVISSFCLVVALMTKCLTDSPRWLYSKKMIDEARRVIRKISSWNRVEITDAQFESFEKNMVIDVQSI